MDYNASLLHYMAIYDKGTELLSYFSDLEDPIFRDFLKYKESFGSTFLHSAAGTNNADFLSNIFEGHFKKVTKGVYFSQVLLINR